jgi:hypothetical protein
MIKFRKQSLFTGKMNEMELPLTEEEFQAGMRLWKEDGLHIQNAFPQLDDDQREFFLTGATPSEWNDAFGEED